jgi:hypothetical protein
MKTAGMRLDLTIYLMRNFCRQESRQCRENVAPSISTAARDRRPPIPVEECCGKPNSELRTLPIDSVQRLRQRELCIFKEAQSVGSGRHLEEPLIFQGEFQYDVARGQPKHPDNKTNDMSKDARGQQRRHKMESANACAENRTKDAHRLDHEQLKPWVSGSVSQEYDQRFGYADQIAQRSGFFVSADKLFMRHIGESSD